MTYLCLLIKIRESSEIGEEGRTNTESDVEDEERKGVSDIWRTRSAEVRHVAVLL